MSKATVAPIEPLVDTRGAASLNTPFAAIAAAAAVVDGSNFAEEGLDARVFPAHTNANRLATIFETTRVAIAINAVFGPTFVQNGTVFRTGALGNADLLNPLRITVQCQVQTTLVDQGFNANGQYIFKVVYNDGANHDVTDRGWYNTAVIGEGSWLFETWIRPNVLTAINWVELQYVNTQIFRPAFTSLVVDQFINRNVHIY